MQSKCNKIVLLCAYFMVGKRTQMPCKTAETSKVILPVSRARTLDRVKAARLIRYFGENLFYAKCGGPFK